MSNELQVLIAMIVYIAVILAIGVYFARRANSSSDEYFLGGRGLGPWVAAMSAEASDMSGWLLMGLPGLAYFTGISEAIWTALGLAIGTYLSWKIVAVRLRKYSAAANNSITLPDFFSNRYGDKKKILMTISAAVILVFFAIYVGSCFAACGKMFVACFNFDYFPMMLIGAVIVFLYTTLGGFLAESVSDFVQGVLMFTALIAVMIGSLIYVGGFDAVLANLQNYNGFLDIFATTAPVLDANGVQQIAANGLPMFGDPSSYGIIAILSTLAWGLGYFGMPQVILRFMAIREPKKLKRSRVIAITWCVISLSCAVLIGIVGRAMLPAEFLTASSAESVFILAATTLFPPFIAGIIVSGILAATMSSADSYMLIASSAIARNFFKELLKKNATEKQVMVVARLTMLALLLFGIWLASDPNSTIFGIVSYAWAGFGACFGPLMLFSLFWRRTNLQGALAGMITGFVVVIVWHNWISLLGGVFAIYELLPAFVLSALAIFVVSKLTAPPSKEITDVFDNYMSIDDDAGVDVELIDAKKMAAAEAAKEASVDEEAAVADSGTNAS